MSQDEKPIAGFFVSDPRTRGLPTLLTESELEARAYYDKIQAELNKEGRNHWRPNYFTAWIGNDTYNRKTWVPR